MALGALNVLDNNKKGFFLMVEGGAIDWALHGNQKGRLIEETAGFFDAVQSVIQWVDKNSSWDETLLIVTADHETGLLWGEKPFAPLIDNGKKQLPGMTFYSSNHSNSLVPFFAKGIGSDWYPVISDEYDAIRGPYMQNSEIPQLLFMMWGK
jgi:alkaline phosphatase